MATEVEELTPRGPTEEDLFGREARCTCGKTAPSTDRERLAFFDYRGEGSRYALTSCAVCKFADAAHDPERMKKNVNPRTVVEQGKCTGFVAIGAHEYDTFYCGCRGWD